MRSAHIATAFALLVLGMPLRPLLAQDGAAPATPQTPSAGIMMQSCEHHQAMAAALAGIEKLVVDTKASKDVSKLQGALDQIGSQVAKMQENGKKCSGTMEMMKMMEKMKSMPQAVATGQPHP